MEFFNKIKKSVENLGKATVVAGTLAGPMVADSNVNQAEAQTILQSVVKPVNMDFRGSELSGEYKYNFEKWVKDDVITNPRVIAEITAMSKLPIDAKGGHMDFLNIDNGKKAQILFSENNGLPTNLVDAKMGIEKIYMTITRYNKMLKNNEVLLVFTTSEKIFGEEKTDKETFAATMVYNPLTNTYRK